MKAASIAEIKASLSSFVKASASGSVVVTRNGKAVAVLIGVAQNADPIWLHQNEMWELLEPEPAEVEEFEPESFGEWTDP